MDDTTTLPTGEHGPPGNAAPAELGVIPLDDEPLPEDFDPDEPMPELDPTAADFVIREPEPDGAHGMTRRELADARAEAFAKTLAELYRSGIREITLPALRERYEELEICRGLSPSYVNYRMALIEAAGAVTELRRPNGQSWNPSRWELSAAVLDAEPVELPDPADMVPPGADPAELDDVDASGPGCLFCPSEFGGPSPDCPVHGIGH